MVDNLLKGDMTDYWFNNYNATNTSSSMYFDIYGNFINYHMSLPEGSIYTFDSVPYNSNIINSIDSNKSRTN